MATYSDIHRNLLRATIFSVLATVSFYVGGINWTETNLQGHVGSYLLIVAFALAPYAILVSLLARIKRSVVAQITVFALVVALPVIGFGCLRINAINTGGWDYIIIPFWQVILLMVINGLCDYFEGRITNDNTETKD